MDETLRADRQEIEDARQQLEALRQGRHQMQLDHLKLTDQGERARSRDAQIERELTEIDDQIALETTQRDAADSNLLRFGEEAQRCPFASRWRCRGRLCRRRAGSS